MALRGTEIMIKSSEFDEPMARTRPIKMQNKIRMEKINESRVTKETYPTF